ncbi:hypothetical protein OH77DRAFT_1515398 [Trametes cingulata]|nr:hypothetical protein OH77DRAFT_1515398 [Trametes cingulata]
MILQKIVSRSAVDDGFSQAGTIGGIIGGIVALIFAIALCTAIARCVQAAAYASRASAITVVQPTSTPTGVTQTTVVNNTVTMSGTEAPPPYTPPAYPASTL